MLIALTFSALCCIGGSSARAEWVRQQANDLDAGSGHHAGPNYDPNLTFQRTLRYKLRVSGVWNIYGPESNRLVGAAGSVGVSAGDGWPAKGSAEGCLMIWVGDHYYGCFTDANRQPDASA